MFIFLLCAPLPIPISDVSYTPNHNNSSATLRNVCTLDSHEEFCQKESRFSQKRGSRKHSQHCILFDRLLQSCCLPLSLISNRETWDSERTSPVPSRGSLCICVCLLFRAYFSGERKNRTFFSNVARRSVGLFDCEFSARKKYRNFRSVISDGNDGSLTAARRLVCELLRCSFGWFMQLNILMKLCDKFFVCSMKIKSFAKKNSSGSARERVRPTAGIAFCARKR